MEPAAAAAAGQLDVDKLTYEIFSILESKFLFGYDDPKLVFSGGDEPQGAVKGTPARGPAVVERGKVCVLSIDGGGRAADGLLAGAALVSLEASLRRRTRDETARLADFFDVAAGSGAGGVLAAMLVARGGDGRPMFSAEDALAFLMRSLRRGWSGGGGGGAAGGIRALFRRPGAAFRKVFGDLTLRDTVRPVLVPCYDLASAGPFLFSRADAVETAAYDFRLRDVCAATCAGSDGSASAVEVRSSDGATRIAAVGGGLALGNPTAAAITHVLNNKREFPLAAGVEDLLVISIGSGECDNRPTGGAAASTSEIVRIAAEGVADMVDQAVAMAFGHNRTNNYIRIQAMGSPRASRGGMRCGGGGGGDGAGWGVAEEMLSQKNVESVLFRGKKLAEQTNAEKLEWFAHELVKERDRRRTAGALAPAVVKQQPSESAPATAAAADGHTPPPTSYSNLVSQMFTTIL
ncbi:patatin-like protein 3 [Oryza glaberrima]|uniref:PNPLA domain-containing protein n=1 Tax=Oryza glaberrima TaxID=4538 RepID=I1PG49_ORYGL|nr:patatin-like protein 3 [Oryza glaberrima]